MSSTTVGGQTDPESVVALIPALRAFARSFYRNPTDADDLVQETLARAIANLDKYQDGTRLKSWLFTIMRNIFYTRARIAKREPTGVADCASLQPVMLAGQEWSIRGREVCAAIERLSSDQREVLLLIGMEGMSYQEAAEICGCAMGTIKSRLNRARSSVLDMLGETSAEALLQTADRLAALPSEGAFRSN